MNGLLELDLPPDGTPVNPLVILDLDEWRDAGPEKISEAASAVAAALPVTAGVLRGPLTPELAPLARACSLVFAESVTRATEIANIGVPLGDEAVARLTEAVGQSPRAAVACGRLVRQTAVLDVTGGLAAEAAVYSMLLGGPEFKRWMAERRHSGRGVPRRVETAAEAVLIDRDSGRLVITLNVPERRNAFSASVREALLGALELAEADPTIESVKLRGNGPAFCSGGDLDEFGLAEDLAAAYLVRLARAPWRIIHRIAPKVTVYAHGACVGAGTEMICFAGRVIAAPGAFFQLPEVRMGLVPGAGGSVSVTRRIGRHRAAWLMLTGEPLDAATALDWGLIDEIA